MHVEHSCCTVSGWAIRVCVNHLGSSSSGVGRVMIVCNPHAHLYMWKACVATPSFSS